MKKIIGLCGKYCAGKNHVAAILEQKGLAVLDIDILGHRVLEAEKNRIIEKFGSSILNSGGMIDRRLLGKTVFNNPEKIAELEEIIHPAVNLMTERWVSEQNSNCVINAALLHKSTFFEKFDFIIIVEAPLLCRMYRAINRDKLSLTELIKRLKSQKDFNSQYFSQKADIYRVDNPDFFLKPGVSSAKTGQKAVKLEKKIDEILKIKV